MDNQLYNQTIGAITSIVQILIPLGGAFYAFYKGKGVDYIEAKIGLIQDKRTQKLIQDAFDRVDELLTDSITSAENTVKQDLIKQISEGKVSKDSLKQIGKDVSKNVVNQLSVKTVEALKYEISDIQQYVNERLETKLANLKLDNTSSVSKTEITLPTKEELDNTSLSTQLNQVQADKDALTQQLTQVQLNVDSLNTQKQQLESDKQALQAKLDSINSALSQVVQPVTNATSIPNQTPVVDNNTAQVQANVILQ